MTRADEQAQAEMLIDEVLKSNENDLNVASKILSKAYNTLRNRIKTTSNK